MKRLYTTIAIFLLLIAIGFFSLFHVRDACEDIVQQIDQVEAIQAEDPAVFLRQLEHLEDIWLKHRDIMLHHVHHEKLDEISAELIRAQLHASEAEYVHMREALSIMRWLIESVWENEIVRLDNIF